MRDSSFIFSDNEFNKDNDDLLLNLEDTHKKGKKDEEINKENKQKIVVTGAAGFIGFHLSKRLLNLGYHVLGIDNLNDYYDVSLKEARLKILKEYEGFEFNKIDIANYEELKKIITPDYKVIIHLAAQAGVRYSLENPWTYIQSNILGHLNILEICRNIPNFHRLIYASSSSVYGSGKVGPMSTSDRVDNPVSLYAATKKADELMTATYVHLYNFEAIGLRLFSVYGILARPDMAPMKFTKQILEGKPIDVYNYGNLKRDFTYVDDIVDGIISSLQLKLAETEKHKIYNLGNNKPEKLMDFICILEKYIGKKAIMNLLPMQKGDVYETYADISESERDLNYNPKVSLEEGLGRMVEWYKDYYQFDDGFS